MQSSLYIKLPSMVIPHIDYEFSVENFASNITDNGKVNSN